MGNQPSVPSSTPAAPEVSLPAPVEICDMECQRQKKLAELKLALDTSKDPESKEHARIAYNTLLYGQGWLVKEKQKIAKSDVEPVVSNYKSQYDALKSEQQTQSMYKTLEDALKAQESADQESGNYFKKQLQTEKDKASTLDRLNSLGSPAGSPINWLSSLMDVLITILGLTVLYLLFSKFTTILSVFGSQSQSVESIV